MSAKKQAADQPQEPTSIRDAGYKFAATGDTIKVFARYVLEQCPNVVESMPDTTRDELREGFQLRKHEITPVQYFKMGDGGKYFPVTEAQYKARDTADTGYVAMSINTAMGYSSQEFGRMRTADPAHYELVKPHRDAFSTYASNKMTSLLREIRSIASEGKTRERAVNKDWDEAVKTAFDTLEKRSKTLKQRGDTRADPVKFLLAKQAFLDKYNA